MRPFCLWLLLVVVGCGPADPPASPPPPEPARSAAPPAPAFDLQALARLNIDQLHAALGPTAGAASEPTPDDVRAGIVEWGREYRRDTVRLRVTYDVQTRQVLDFYATTAHGRTTDLGPLLQLLHVPANDPHWSIEPFALPGRPGVYLGVRLAPQ